MGADTERVYTLFIGPPEKEAEWSDEAVAGAYRFLNRVWRIGGAAAPRRRRPRRPTPSWSAQRHATIQRVTHELRALLVQHRGGGADGAARTRCPGRSRRRPPRGCVCEETFDTLLQLLHPMAPHITEELWERRGHVESLLDTDWPELRRGEDPPRPHHPGGPGGRQAARPRRGATPTPTRRRCARRRWPAPRCGSTWPAASWPRRWWCPAG